MSRSGPSQPEAQHQEAAPAAGGHHHARERVREGLTMALYVSLSLLAVLVALPSSLDPGTSASPALTIFLTSIGLILAHALAFRISTRLVHRGELSAPHLDLLAGQIGGGLAVTAAAVTPVLIIGGPGGVRAAEFVLLAFVAVVAYLAARSVPMSRLRALGYVTIIVVLTLGVLWVKSLVYH